MGGFEQDKEHLDGTVNAIIFQNEENGYTILRLEQEGELYTVVGCMPGVTTGEELFVTGSWTRHPTFGPQFKAELVERRIPSSTKAIFTYLSSGIIKGIGDMTARRIVDAFGEEALDVLERDPERLATVKGISRKKAREINASFLQQSGMRRLLEFLAQHQLPVQLGTTLWRSFGAESLGVLRQNPYLLVGEPYRVAFAKADQLALSLGLEEDSALRAEAGLIYTLSHNLNNGHVFLPENKLLPAAARLLGLSEDSMELALDSLAEQGRIVREGIAGEQAVYLSALYQAETRVAERLSQMCRRELLPPKNVDTLISRIELEQRLTYAPQQREAVEMAASHQVMLLTGGPGTGKTTSLRGILALFEMLRLKTALAAPTGRAAKRLGDLCGQEAATIHRLLETGFDNETGELAFSKDEDDPLDAAAVIVDETSMVDIQLMDALLSALKNDCRLVLVGDPDQLPSVGPGNLFADLIRSGAIPTVRLTTVFRQAQESAIIVNAHRVNRMELPLLDNKSKDFFFLRRRDGQRAVDTIVELCRTRLPKNMGIPADQIQVLSPTRKYDTGTVNLNRALQAALNPPSPGKNERKTGAFTFREGDRVMQVKNNYDIMWRNADGRQGGMGVFNGDIGFIQSIDPRGEVVTVNFDEQRIVEYTPDLLNELEPAYAMTVHKSQGSEYRAVILAALDGAPMLLSRGVLYTAITRAKELLIIVGDDQVVYRMATNNRQTRRYSGLRARLAGEAGNG